MKTEYAHPQEPDTQPGPYYVSAIDGGRAVMASGPYNDHATALAAVDVVRELVCRHDAKAHFYAFGTARKHDPASNKPGVIQRWGYPLVTGADDPDELSIA